jgi:hypothetical protein
MKQIKISQGLVNVIENINHTETRCKIYTAVFNYCFLAIEPELEGETLVIWKIIKPLIESVNKTAVVKKSLHSFEHSPYYVFESFEMAFKQTKTFRENPMISIPLLYDACVLAEPTRYKYSDWIRAAQNWYKMHPERYFKSIKSAIQKDAAFALMTKGDISRAEHDAKMALQRKLINNGNDPYSY